MPKKKAVSIFYTTYKAQKCIEELNVRPETIKLLEENIDIKLFDITLSDIFRICFLRQGKQEKKWEYMKLEFLHSEGNHQQNEKMIP